MKNNNDFALLLLKKARQDALLIEKLSGDAEIADDVVGFHFQQVVEKSLKALLVFKNIKFRRTHDIRELLDLLKDNAIPAPSWFEGLDSWTPYAAEYRYDDLPEGANQPIDRAGISSLAYAAIEYVEQQCTTGKG
jgi:HEPN domain-containing protein